MKKNLFLTKDSIFFNHLIILNCYPFEKFILNVFLFELSKFNLGKCFITIYLKVSQLKINI